MEPLIARGILSLMLTTEQNKELKDIEKVLPNGRYLQGFEVCRHFRLKPEPLDSSREQAMLTLLWDWRKINARFEKDDNIHDWMDYVKKEWIEPLPSSTGKLGGVFDED